MGIVSAAKRMPVRPGWGGNCLFQSPMGIVSAAKPLMVDSQAALFNVSIPDGDSFLREASYVTYSKLRI